MSQRNSDESNHDPRGDLQRPELEEDSRKYQDLFRKGVIDPNQGKSALRRTIERVFGRKPKTPRL